MPVDLARSVAQRLLNLARERREEYGRILITYANERFLFRLSQSTHSGGFVLKGATLFTAWMGKPLRATRDLDFLAHGDSSPESLRATLFSVCQTEVEPDGLTFKPAGLRIEPIREEQQYGGQRVLLGSHLGRARVQLQLDIGFGDVVTPAAAELRIPTLLDFPAPHIRSYPMESMIAEKFEAMVRLDFANSRMKDFFDIWSLSQFQSFRGDVLGRAVEATFARRRTSLPDGEPIALTAKFSSDVDHQAQWQAFVSRSGVEVPVGSLNDIVNALRDFLLPLYVSLRKGDSPPGIWPPRGPWKPLLLKGKKP